MSLRDIIAKYGSPYDVTRLADGVLVKGQLTPGAPSTIPIVAFIEPTDGAVLEDVAEGQRANEVRRLFTLTELRDKGNPDTITVDAEPWTVTACQRFDGLGGTHYVAMIARTVNP